MNTSEAYRPSKKTNAPEHDLASHNRLLRSQILSMEKTLIEICEASLSDTETRQVAIAQAALRKLNHLRAVGRIPILQNDQIVRNRPKPDLKVVELPKRMVAEIGNVGVTLSKEESELPSFCKGSKQPLGKSWMNRISGRFIEVRERLKRVGVQVSQEGVSQTERIPSVGVCMDKCCE